MKKYFIKGSNTEVKLGDKFTVVRDCDTTLGEGKTIVSVVVTNSNIDSLIEEGILEVKDIYDNKSYVDYFNTYMAKREPEYTYYTQNDIIESCEIIGYNIVLQVVLKEIADTLNSNYNEPIEKSKSIYAISLTNGKIARLNKDCIVNYNNFAAFRTFEDVAYARAVVTPLLIKMFPENYNN